MPKFSNENWGQAFRMYCNTTAWGYNPTYKHTGNKHTVTWESDYEKTSMGRTHSSAEHLKKDHSKNGLRNTFHNQSACMTLNQDSVN